MADSIARTVDGMGRLFRNWRPDLLLVLGDRFEMFAGALGAVPYHIPIAHLHGGDITAGAIDDSFRHALSKFAHLHFVTTQDSAARLRRMGEEPWRITVSGAPALDRLHTLLPEKIELPEKFILVTFHPVTREPGQESVQVDALVSALRRSRVPCVVTAPNADPGNSTIRRKLESFCASDGRSMFVENLGARRYFTVMSRASAMVGNSSSGMFESPSFRLPVVNIGIRQEGRLRARNVIDCDCTASDIFAAIRRATSPAFRASLRGLRNPYGDGKAARRIVNVLERTPLDGKLLMKRFNDNA
jgi:UDP-hydrolysing UDP-N-acetyl-D-glucosamine 2-epimerase